MLRKRTSKNSVVISLLTIILLSTSCSHPKSNFGVVFSANLHGNQDLYYTSSTDFEYIKKLTSTPNDPEKDIKVTRDGNRILFYVPGPSTSRIISESLTSPSTHAHTYIFNLKTNKIMEIDDTLGLYPTMPLGWSIDEDQAILLELSSRKIYLVNPDEKSPRELKVPPSGVSELLEFNYSPDGKRILYIVVNKYADPSFTSFLYDVETMTATQLGDTGANCVHAEWSPTGKEILLLCDLSTDGITPDYHVNILDITGNDTINVKQIADFPQCTDPTWSPSGKQIIMLCIKDDQRGIFLADSNGTGYKEIKINPLVELPHVWEISWSPDGQQFLYVAGEDQDLSNIYITNIDGSNNHVITTQATNYRELTVFAIP